MKVTNKLKYLGNGWRRVSTGGSSDPLWGVKVFVGQTQPTPIFHIFRGFRPLHFQLGCGAAAGAGAGAVGASTFFPGARAAGALCI